jgi:hypothetical protein
MKPQPITWNKQPLFGKAARQGVTCPESWWATREAQERRDVFNERLTERIPHMPRVSVKGSDLL